MRFNAVCSHIFHHQAFGANANSEIFIACKTSEITSAVHLILKLPSDEVEREGRYVRYTTPFVATPRLAVMKVLIKQLNPTI